VCRNTSGLTQFFIAGSSYSTRYSTTSPSNFSFTSSWCTHAAGRFITGNFGGTGRTDVLCQDASTGHQWIDFSAPSGQAYTTFTSEFDRANTWCAYAAGRVLPGDVNGDGLTDLYCWDSYGTVEVQLASATSPTFPGTDSDALGTVEPVEAGGGCDVFQTPFGSACVNQFCVGTWAGTLAVADYTGDGRTDLLCRTPTFEGTLRPYVGDPTNADMLNAGDPMLAGWAGLRSRPVTLNAATQTWY
jgi:hypothetical protein